MGLDYDSLDTLKRIHPAWRLLAADLAPLIISFVHRCFIEPNVRTLPEQDLVSRLDDYLFHLREKKGQDAFKRTAKEYLDEWTSDTRGWLRKYYPPGDDQPHFDLTSATERAVDWVISLHQKEFVGTESRLKTIFELLRQMTEGTESDPITRIADLEKRRSLIEAEITNIRDGRLDLLDPTAIKERFVQMAGTARGLLSDFREVEQNFRELDRKVRDRIATWEGGKGALLDDVFGTSDAINDSDQGRSFRAFWDFLMSSDRQDELTSLLETVFNLPAVAELNPDRRLLRVHYDWLQAGEVTQRTVARLSEQLRRYLDDQTLLENKRIMQILKAVEQHAIAVREFQPRGDIMDLDDSSTYLDFFMDRPMFSPPIKPVINDQILLQGDQDFQADVLYKQEHVDKARLKAQVRKALQTREQISLEELVESFPLAQGLSELITYLSLAAEDGCAIIDDSGKQTLSLTDRSGTLRRAVLPMVIFNR